MMSVSALLFLYVIHYLTVDVLYSQAQLLIYTMINITKYRENTLKYLKVLIECYVNLFSLRMVFNHELIFVGALLKSSALDRIFIGIFKTLV